MPTISLAPQEGRFARLEAIEWWDQALLARSHVLVIGAGALGNEVVKNLALLGLGHVVIADMDRVELSNLSRSVLFRESDEGRFKAECAARAAREIFPGIDAHAFVGNVLADLGLGYFRWADVVIGALANHGTPTTPTTASIIAAMQVQEVIKHLHGRPALLGKGFVFDGANHGSYPVNYRIAPDCPWHEPPAPIESAPDFGQSTPLRAIWQESERRLGPLDAIDFAREIVGHVECGTCHRLTEVFRPAEHVTADELLCPQCRTECAPTFVHSVTAQSPLLDRTIGGLGLPAWDVVWARAGDRVLGWELTADAAKLDLHHAPRTT